MRCPMSFSIRLTEEERKLAEAFKKALFEKIEDEYDIIIAEEAYKDYEKSGCKSRHASELWKELGI